MDLEGINCCGTKLVLILWESRERTVSFVFVEEVIMKQLSGLDWAALVILIIGGINWGLVGFFTFDLVQAIFGPLTAMSRIIYALVGISAIYIAVISPGLSRKTAPRREAHRGVHQPT
ncbi:DUF378 domain-containing protein [Chitinispirillum alkaliphilum]|nr:DUF378 domain-containing protein [Chitinispirillum alkaliphilum]